MKTKTLLLVLSSTLIFLCNELNAQVNTGDSLALVDLYNNNGGNSWRNHTNWLTTQPVSTWYGITVANNRVVSINLNGNRLGGVLQPSLGNLDSLAYLNFYTNSLRDSIPSFFGNLKKLSYLNLSSNFFDGNIPSSIGNAQNLTLLDVSVNQLTGLLPASLGKLKKLSLFRAVRNQLSGTIPDSLGYCSSLDTLDISINTLSGTLPSTFVNLHKLTILNVSANTLSGSLPNVFSDSNHLVVFEVSANQFTGRIPTFFTKYKQLQTLGLGSNKFTGVIPLALTKISSLRNLTLSQNALSGSIPAAFNNMPNLASLSLAQDGLSGQLPLLFHNYSIPDFGLDIGYNNITTNRNPQWNGAKSDAGLKLYNNRFTFDGLEYFNEKYFGPTDYPQAPLTIHLRNNKLSVSAGGTLNRNTYKWYKVGSATPVTIKGDSTYQPAASGKYYVNVTNSAVRFLALISDTISYTIAAVVTPSLSFYPNPVKGMITINNLNEKTDATITIADMSGYVWAKAVSHQQSAIRIDAGRLKPGSYLVNISDGKEVRTLQFVKE